MRFSSCYLPKVNPAGEKQMLTLGSPLTILYFTMINITCLREYYHMAAGKMP
jgi:hypothetical protein